MIIIVMMMLTNDDHVSVRRVALVKVSNSLLQQEGQSEGIAECDTQSVGQGNTHTVTRCWTSA